MNQKTQHNYCFGFDKAKAVVLSGCFFILLAVTTSAEAQSAIDLSTWSVVQYELNEQADANWILNNDNTLVTQTVNADASIFLSDFTLTNDKIEGTFRVTTSSDDDFIGFVFGYQDSQHFYLFDWKQGNQNDSLGFAEQGMSVKLVNADSELTGQDLWPTEGNGERVNILFHNQIGWEDFTDYQFSLEFHPGEFTITVSEGNTVLDSVTLQDSSYTSGPFGFYNYSQGGVEYRRFERTELSTVQFSSATYSVTENGGQATITVTRSGGSQGAISVDYATSDETATAGSDYTAASGTLNWADGDAADKTFTVNITDDSELESNETLFVSLGNPTGSAQLGEPDTTVVTITDNDNAQPGTPQFTSSTVEVAETASTVTLTVRRVGGTNGELTVNYATTDGTATDGSDYVGATGTLSWGDGDSSDKTLTVTITDDSLSEGNETFTVILSDPVSGESLDSGTVSIIDNDTTLVTLVDFSAIALENSIEIVWITNTEFDSIGFHLWRATGKGWKNGDYSTVTRLTEQLIPAEGNSGAGATYSYIDSDVEPGVTYYYGLEDRNGVGQPTYYLDDIDSATAK